MNVEEILGVKTKSYLKAIVYVSSTGFTERYAKMLSNEIGIPAYPLTDAPNHINEGDGIIFMGWVNKLKVTGYQKAAKVYNIIAVCAVGMSSYSFDRTIEVRDNNGIEDAEVFWLQGGFDINKLPAFTKFLMKIGTKALIKELSKKAESKGLSYDEEEALEIYKNGGDFVSMENLNPVLDWIRNNFKKN
ncbi:MAG: hypothetical protein GX802_05650 [Clostridiales bacterium]|nr:hypothetical protein [Clostridiales bacterium]